LAPSRLEYSRLLDADEMMNNARSAKKSDQPPQLVMHIELPDETVMNVKADSSVTGSELLLEVFRSLSLPRQYVRVSCSVFASRWFASPFDCCTSASHTYHCRAIRSLVCVQVHVCVCVCVYESARVLRASCVCAM
jgi:hypothetical protein